MKIAHKFIYGKYGKKENRSWIHQFENIEYHEKYLCG
jgi:hypothetical protein